MREPLNRAGGSLPVRDAIFWSRGGCAGVAASLAVALASCTSSQPKAAATSSTVPASLVPSSSSFASAGTGPVAVPTRTGAGTTPSPIAPPASLRAVVARERRALITNVLDTPRLLGDSPCARTLGTVTPKDPSSARGLYQLCSNGTISLARPLPAVTTPRRLIADLFGPPQPPRARTRRRSKSARSATWRSSIS